MRAAVCREFARPLVVEEIDVDPPGAGEIGVRLAACAICHSDLHAIDGAWGGALPAVFGHEAAGVVDVVGPGAEGVAVGDPVVVSLLRSCGRCFFCVRGEPWACDATFALDTESRLHARDGAPIRQGIRTGAFAERVVVDDSQAVKVPPSLPLDRASLLACGVITGLGAVCNTAGVPSGASVVVIGTGGVGLNSVQGAVLCGADPIVAVDVSSGKLEIAESFGATHALDATARDLPAAVRACTDGRGADYVFVTVGSASAIEQGLGLMRRGGTLVVVGMPPSGVKAQFEAVEFADAGMRIVGSKMGSTRLAIDVPKLVDLYERGRLKLDELITGRYPLEAINEAIEGVRRGEVLRNVVVP